MFTNEYLLQLKKEFGKFGSWALWDEDGGIENIIKDKKFISLIKPNIIFMGLNASRDLREDIDWVNFHFQKIRKISWGREHCRKLADVLSEPEFSYFSGSYMTDVIKTNYDSSSGNLMKAIKRDDGIIAANEEILKREMKLLSRISGSDKFIIICNGKKSFDILNKVSRHAVYKIWHYSAYQLGWDGVKEQIRQDLREIMKRLQKSMF
jgi:hypothetical protein